MPKLIYDPATEPDKATADAEWKRLRRTGVGASEAGVLTGTAKFGSKYQLYCNKLGIGGESEQTERMAMGKRMERTIMECLVEDMAFVAEFGTCTWSSVQRLYAADGHPLVLATPDAEVLSTDALPLLVECKNTRWDDAWENGPPAHVIDQVQQQMLVMAVDRCIVAWLLHGDTFKWAMVNADPQRQLLIARAIDDFWTHHIVPQVPPAVTDKDTDILRRQFTKAEGDPVPLPGEFIALDALRVDLMAQQDTIKKSLDAVNNQFRAAIGNAPAGMLPNGVTYSFGTVVKKEYVVKASSYKELRRKDPKEDK